MAKEKFNWKGLFINDEGEKKETLKKEVTFKETTTSKSFPKTNDSVSKFPEKTIPSTPINSTVLEKIIEMYESGFDSLNQPGYDFYEFFKAIKAVGSNDPSIYKMAMSMATGVDPKITKEVLLTKADFYVQEIDNVHKQYQTQGNSKKATLQKTQKVKEETLASEISKLEQQLLDIQNQISQKKNQLQSIDSELLTEVAEIEQKIVANNMAKSKILETITSVIDGIKNNL